MEKGIFSIFIKGIQNLSAVEGKIDSSYSRFIKMELFYLASAILSKRVKDNNELFIASRLDKIDNSLVGERSSIIYRQRCFKKPLNFVSYPTFLSLFPYFNRFKILFKAIGIAHKINKNPAYKGMGSYWIDFIIIAKAIESTRPKHIVHRFHFDEKATWIGELKKYYHYDVDIYQHGVVGKKIAIPNKIFCDRFYSFDKYSTNYFKRYVLSTTYNYEIEERQFLSSIIFKQFHQKESNKKLVGIAEQCNPKWVECIVDHIDQEKNQIIIMKHPNSNYNYGSILKYKSVQTNDKFDNLSAIITENSTLMLDYYWSNKHIPIIFTDPTIYECFIDYPFIFCANIDNIQSLY